MNIFNAPLKGTSQIPKISNRSRMFIVIQFILLISPYFRKARAYC